VVIDVVAAVVIDVVDPVAVVGMGVTAQISATPAWSTTS
jgi:hypothetical protein